MRNALCLIRGLPGSGKSTLARSLVEEGKFHYHFEADQFLYENGEYKWEGEKLSAAHGKCFSSTESALAHGFNVVVSDTNLFWRDMKVYCQLAKDFDVELIVIECTGDYGSIHDVPEYKLTMMKERRMSSEQFLEFYAERIAPVETITYIFHK